MMLASLMVCVAVAAPDAEPGDRALAEWGVLDVTAAPFGADPTGRRDSTQGLQAAIDHARSHCMVAFFPPGEYRVSDTLRCHQGRLHRKERAADPKLVKQGFGIGPRALPCVLIGSRRGSRRPRIVLAPRSPGFDNPKKRKYVVHFWRGMTGKRPQPNASFNQMFVGIDITIGPGNPGAVGIRHRAAQGSAVQDCTIDATHGLTGLEGGAGSGGGHVNVTVVGGRVGADLFEAQPAPTITGFTLVAQTGTALRYAGYETLTAVGLRIEMDGPGPAIVTDPRRLSRDLFGQLSLVDSTIVFRKPGANVAVEARTSLYMNNVYVKGARLVARHLTDPHLEGDPSGWLRVVEYARGVDPPNKRLVHQYRCPAYVDGRKLPGATLPARVDPAAAPPADLQSRHVWGKGFPNWETAGAVNVKDAPYNARGDGQTDDTRAIQRAIDEHDVVFLPRGRYRVTRTLRLRPDTKLVGVHRVFSLLVAASEEGGSFVDRAKPQPVVRTADDADARTVLAFLGVSARVPGAYCLDWRAGRRSIFRAVELWASYSRKPAKGAPVLAHPQAVVRGHGGGRWYNFHSDHFGSPHSAYRHLVVAGTTEPLAFYQCNPEHSRGESNMELRHARHVSIYGLKGENPTPILVVRDCDHVHVFGYGGNAIPPAGKALLRFERTPNFVVANLVDRPMGVRGDPTSWPALIERTAGGRTIALPPLERPVIYRRGEPVRR